MLILASQSPRRREILDMLGFKFLCKPSDADETLPEGIEPAEAVRLLAKRKADAVGRPPEDVVLGADTMVVLDKQILGKPHDTEDARRMLRALSSRTHTVFTGVCITGAGRSEQFVTHTDVTFYKLTDEEIDDYIATGDPMDKAGAYGIQSVGAVNVRKINGDYFTVMGLPAAETARALKNFQVVSRFYKNI